MDYFTTLFEKAAPTPSALIRMTALVFMLQGIVAWGVLNYSIDGNSTADEDLSSGITTRLVKRSAMQAHTTLECYRHQAVVAYQHRRVLQ